MLYQRVLRRRAAGQGAMRSRHGELREAVWGVPRAYEGDWWKVGM